MAGTLTWIWLAQVWVN